MNLNRLYQIKRSTLSQSTDIPKVKKYKPCIISHNTWEDCLNGNFISGMNHGWCKPISLTFTTDSFGYRNKVAYHRKGFNIIVLGDSFGIGNVDDSETIPAFLFNKYELKTYNLSVSGSGPWAQYMTLKKELGRINVNPNTVIIWLLFSGNDLTEFCGPIQNIKELYSLTTRLQFMRDDFYDFRNKSPVRALILNFIYKYTLFRNPETRVKKNFINNRKIAFNHDYIVAALRSYSDVIAHFNFDCLNETFRNMNEIVSREKIDLRVVLLPSKEEVYEWVLYDNEPWTSGTEPSGFSKAIKEMAEKNNFKFFDTKQYFLEQSKEIYMKEKMPLYWYTDSHLNPRGNELISDYIFSIFNVKK